jgi:hypothetical protein
MKQPTFTFLAPLVLLLLVADGALGSAFAAPEVATRGVALEAPTLAVDHVFLLIGQSNMAGRGRIEPIDRVPDPRVFVLDRTGRWAPAVAPLHFDKPDIAGVGPGGTFGRAVAAAHPDWIVGLVPAAMGGSSLDEWRPGGKLYTDAVARTRTALRGGARLTAILWHQGESDEAAPLARTYVPRFAAMIAQLRAELKAEDVPLIAGELGRFTSAAAHVNPQLARLPEAVPHCRLVSSAGLTDRGDHLHFDSPSARELGRRYAQAFEQPWPSPLGKMGSP